MSIVKENIEMRKLALNLAVKLLVLTHEPDRTDITFGSYFNSPFHLQAFSPLDLANSITITLHLVNPTTDAKTLVLQASKFHFLEDWQFHTYRPGDWVNKLVSLLEEIETNNFANIDDFNFFSPQN